VGDVDIIADALTIKNGARISIAANQILPDEHLADIQETSIRIKADNLNLDQDARITSESSGNVPAAPVHIEVHKLIMENGSRITTSANEADGGPIVIRGEVLLLQSSLITTSVEGSEGTGGDVTISGPVKAFVLDSGFIQANTEAENARGGDIFIDAKALIAEGGKVEIGGSERQVFKPDHGKNIIQAAAPGGEQGVIKITAPDPDISGSLVKIAAGFFEPIRLAANPCRTSVAKETSSLILTGRGGIPADPAKPSVISFGKNRLEKILKTGKDKYLHEE